MKKTYADADLREILGTDRADSALINQKMQEAYEEIRRRGNKGKIVDINTRGEKEISAQSERVRKAGQIRKKAMSGFGVAAAAFVMAIIFFAANPSLAEEIPVLGSILNKMQGIARFGGAPEDEIIYLQGEQDTDASEAENMNEFNSTTVGQVTQEQTAGAADMWETSVTSDNAVLSWYQATDQGLTVTLTEYYASNQGISIGVRVESEEAFPEMAVMLAEPRNQLLQLMTTETYSFRDEGDQVVSGFRNLEGKLVDEHTFEGVMRIDYESIHWDERKYSEAYRAGEAAEEETGVPFEGIEINDETFDDWISEYEVPKSFQMQFAIQSFRIYTYEQKYIIRGDWTFSDTLEIRQSTKDTATIWVNETNEYGWGLEYVEISPTEVTVHSIKPDGSSDWPIILDKNNRPLVLSTHGNQFGTYGRDTSIITVYVCDERIHTVNEAAYLPDGTLDEELYAELLGESAQYTKTIDTTLYLQEE